MEDNLYAPAGRPLVTSAVIIPLTATPLIPLKKANTVGSVTVVWSRASSNSITTWE